MSLQGLTMGAPGPWTTNIWTRLREVRAERPVLVGAGGRFADIPNFPNIFATDEQQPSFLTLTYEHTRPVLASSSASRRAGVDGDPLQAALGPGALPHIEDPYHAKLRSLIMPTFRRSTLERWR